MAYKVNLRPDRANHALRVWRSEALGGILFSRGGRVTHAYPRHWHEELHFCAYTAGSGFLAYGGNSHRICESDFVITPPGEVHENWVDSDIGISFYGGYVDDNAFSNAAQQVMEQDLPIPAARDFIVPDKRLRQRFLAVCTASDRGDSRLQQEAAFLEFVDVLFSRRRTRHPPPAQSGNERAAVKRVRDYLDANFSQSISLTELGRLARLSPYHLHHVFRKEIGLPPHAYQTQLRINRAKQLLRDRHPLSDIAASIGFADQSHLTRHFHRLVGITPGRFLT